MTGGFGADYTFEATGLVDVMRQAVESARMGWGLATVCGVAGKGETLDVVPRFLITGRRVAGSSFGGVKGRDQVPQFVDRYLAGDIDVDPLISHTLSLDEVNRGFDLMHAQDGIRSVISFDTWPLTTLSRVAELRTTSTYSPTGDQPQAIETLADGILAGEQFQTLVGATGTGKTATMAWTIEKVGRPALVIAHNKTLAAQLCNEFREFFPHNAVEYFVSYYDYYQPEAYVPQADLYIEKDSSRNDDIARLRLSATSSLFTRRDVVVVASVSCIYGLGSPEEWRERMIYVEVGAEHDRDLLLRKLIDSQYVRNDTMLGRGRFRVKGDVVEVQPANQETAYRISFFGDEVEGMTHFDPLTGEVLAKLDNLSIWPATEYVTSQPTVERAVDEIRARARAAGRALRGGGEAARGAPDPAAHRVRPRDAEGARLLQRDRELLADPRGTRRRDAPVHAPRLLPERLRRLRRRVAPDGAAARRHVRGRPLAQADARRLRLPAPFGARQPAAALRRVPAQGAAARLRLGDAGVVRAPELDGRRRAADPADRHRRPRRRAAARRRTRSTTCSARSARARRRASASSSRR